MMKRLLFLLAFVLVAAQANGQPADAQKVRYVLYVPQASEPFVCDGTTDGTVYSKTDGTFQFCDGTSWETTAADTLDLLSCSTNEIAKWNGGAWACAADATGGGGANLFETIDAPAGTDPVADTTTDTLTLTASGPLTITGTAASDTIDFAVTAHFSPDADPGVDHSSYVAGHADGANCAAGEYPLGVDAAGAVQSCTDATTETNSLISTHAGDASAHHAATVDTNAGTICGDGTFLNGDGTCDTGFLDADGTDADTIFTPNADPGVDHASYVAGHGNGADCAAGSYPLGVDAAGAVTSCTDATTEIDSAIATHAAVADAHREHASLEESAEIDSDIATHAGNASAHHAEVTAVVRSFSFVLETPDTADSGALQYSVNLAGTITRIQCSTDTGTVDINLEERALATPNSAGTDAMAADLQCDSDSATQTSFSNAAFDATDPLALTISATASTPGWLRVHVTWTGAP
jgi:hypothetical protein